jgi:hypothetical protein
MIARVFIVMPKEGLCPNHSFYARVEFTPDERFGFEGGSGNAPFEAKSFWIGIDFMVKVFCVFCI